MRIWLVLGAVNAFIAVAAGAFGAHGLRERVEPHLLDVWKTAAMYQMFHALGLLAVGFLNKPGAAIAGWLMLVGIVLFSGSLYIMTLTGAPKLGAITPFGGLCFLAAWVVFAIAAAKSAA